MNKLTTIAPRLLAVLLMLALPGCYVENLNAPITMRDVNAQAEVGRNANVAPVTTLVPATAPTPGVATPQPDYNVEPNDWVRTKFKPGKDITGIKRGWNVEYDPGSGQILSAAMPGNATTKYYLVNPNVPNDLLETIHLNKYMVSRQVIVYNASDE